jgi:hypothetical protein
MDASGLDDDVDYRWKTAISRQVFSLHDLDSSLESISGGFKNQVKKC